MGTKLAPRMDQAALSPSSLAPIRSVQLYEQIRDRLIAQVTAGSWQPGQRLPPERELALSLGVSRPSVREALAALQLAGIVETRHGSGSWIAMDGLKVLEASAPSPSALGASVSPVALLDAREIIEPAAARLAAALHPQDRELERELKTMATISDLSDSAKRAAWNTADRLFHRRIAQLTGNPVLAQFADHVFNVMDEPLWRQLRDEMLVAEGRIEMSVAEHYRIYDALTASKQDIAARVARDHVRKVRHFMGLG